MMQHKEHCIIGIFEALNQVISWLKPQHKSLQIWLDSIKLPEGITLEIHENIVFMVKIPKYP